MDNKHEMDEMINKMGSSLPKLNQLPKHRVSTSVNRKALSKRKKRDTFTDYSEAILPNLAKRCNTNIYMSESMGGLDVNLPSKMPNKPTKRKLTKRFFPILVVGVFLFVMVYSATKMSLWSDENAFSKEQMSDAQNMIVEKVIMADVQEDTVQDISGGTTELMIDYSNLPIVDVDFSKLKTVNSDTVAYIKINGLDVNAPVVQTDDNDYYLDHSFDKTANSAGWIFGDYRNDWSNLKDNTIIYGHNRRNYMMFGALKLILEEKWYSNKDNHFIYISTDQENMVFQIFSAYTIPTETYYLQNTFSDKNEYREFLSTLSVRSQVDFGTTVDENDKILTLSTCYTNTSKTVVHAKLVKRQSKSL